MSAFGWSDTFGVAKAGIVRDVFESRLGTGLAVSTVDLTNSKRRRTAMRANTTTLLLTLALAASTLNCAGVDTVTAQPDSKLVGSWVGTWKIDGSATDHGDISVSVSECGTMTGKMEYSGSEEQESFGAGTLTGQVNGSAATFSYKFANLDQVFGTGSFDGVSDVETKITFSADGSSDRTGYFDLAGAPYFKARILDETWRKQD
jgi:hypothetical protein